MLNSAKSYIFGHPKTIALILIILLASGYAIFSLANPKTVETQYITTNVTRQTLVESLTATGTISIANLRNLNFRSAGRVNKINFKTGDKVKTGDVIATIDKTDLENTLAQSQANLNQAKNNLQNRKISNAPTKYDIANLEESVKTSEVKLSGEKFNLDQTTLKSPVNGKVVSINNVVGDLVTAVNAGTGLPSEGDKLSLENAVKTAQAKVDQDKLNLDQVTLMSPITGTVVAVNYNAGDSVNSTGSTVAGSSQYDISNLQIAVKNAEQTLNDAVNSADKIKAQNALTQANNNLQKALSSGNGFVVIRNSFGGQTQSVNFGVAGKIKTVNVSTGTDVIAGKSLLGTLDPNSLQTQLNTDQAALDLALYNAQKAPNSNALMVVSNDDNNGQNQNISFLVSGRLAELAVKVGDKISKGDFLAKLDPTTYQNSYSLSESALNQAKNNLANRYASNAPTSFDLANLQESVNVAKIKLSVDTENLKNADLISPIDGTLTSLKISEGDTVSAGSISSQTESSSGSSTSSTSNSVAVISDLDHPVINISIGESDIAKVKIGQLAQVSFDALGEKKYVSKVDSIDLNPTITSNVVSYTVRLVLSKSDENIKPGMSASSTIITNTKDSVLVVPSTAVKTVNQQATVQVLVDGKPQTVNVQTGLLDGTNTEIINGLTENDLVITSTIIPNSANKTSNQNALTGLGIGGGNRNAGQGAGRIPIGNGQ